MTDLRLTSIEVPHPTRCCSWSGSSTSASSISPEAANLNLKKKYHQTQQHCGNWSHAFVWQQHLSDFSYTCRQHTQMFWREAFYSQLTHTHIHTHTHVLTKGVLLTAYTHTHTHTHIHTNVLTRGVLLTASIFISIWEATKCSTVDGLLATFVCIYMYVYTCILCKLLARFVYITCTWGIGQIHIYLHNFVCTVSGRTYGKLPDQNTVYTL